MIGSGWKVHGRVHGERCMVYKWKVHWLHILMLITVASRWNKESLAVYQKKIENSNVREEF